MTLQESARRSHVLKLLLAPALSARKIWMDFKLASARGVLDRLAEGLSSDLTMRAEDYMGEFVFPPRSHLLRRILETGAYEPELAKLFVSLIKSDRDVIDVGANIGLFTVLAGKVLTTGRVLSAEPTDGAFSRLTANVARNGVADRVVLYNGLVAQSDSTAMLNVVEGREEYSSMAGIVHPSAAGEFAKPISIKTRTIDSLVAEHKLSPALIKVDVEGAEGMVFEGAENTLREHRPVVLSEFSRPLLCKNGSSPEEIMSLLRRCGYEVRNPFRHGRPGSIDYDEIIAIPLQRTS